MTTTNRTVASQPARLPSLPRRGRIGSAVASAAITAVLFCGIGFGMTAMGDDNLTVASRAVPANHA